MQKIQLFTADGERIGSLSPLALQALRDIMRDMAGEQEQSPAEKHSAMCPHQPDEEWMEVQSEPEEWEQAVAIDEMIFASHGARLRRSGKPLSDVQFALKPVDEYETLFRPCDSGFCWT